MAKGMATPSTASATGSPVRVRDSGRGRAEWFIHSEVLRRASSVGSCAHTHKTGILLYAAGDVPFLLSYHTVGYLGSGKAPIIKRRYAHRSFGSRCAAIDIVPLYNMSDVKDSLATQPRFRASFEVTFGDSGTFPEHVSVLMKQHGLVTCAATIEEAVYQAGYAKEAALAETVQVVLW
ncbi:hypothetical protein DL765_006983 [Monosporascus sp. GIB2]|nr:hypothetical protein DL765_006983 [Monosporascus sp. GIB2]